MRFPRHMLNQYGSKRNFKQMKRNQVRELRRAYSSLQSGCAYLPDEAYRLAIKISSDINRLQALVSVKKWGR